MERPILAACEGSSIRYREIEGYPGYWVGTDGTIWSLRIRIAQEMDEGHLRVQIPNASGVQVRRWVHHLVLEAFVGARPEGLIGLHNDDNPANNCVENLRWGTHADNARDAVVNGGRQTGGDAPAAKLTEEDLIAIAVMRQRGMTQEAVAKVFGVHRTTISLIELGKTWKRD